MNTQTLNNTTNNNHNNHSHSHGSSPKHSSVIESIAIFNPKLNTRNSENIEDVQKEIIYYYPETVSVVDQIKDIGLAKAIIKFTNTFQLKDTNNTIHSLKFRQILIQPEKDFWISMKINIEKFQQLKTSQSGSQDNMEYINKQLNDTYLESKLNMLYLKFKIFNDSFSNILNDDSVETLKEKTKVYFNTCIPHLNFDSIDLLSTITGLNMLSLTREVELEIEDLMDKVHKNFPMTSGSILFWKNNVIYNDMDFNYLKDMTVLYDYLIDPHLTSLSNSAYPSSYPAPLKINPLQKNKPIIKLPSTHATSSSSASQTSPSNRSNLLLQSIKSLNIFSGKGESQNTGFLTGPLRFLHDEGFPGHGEESDGEGKRRRKSSQREEEVEAQAEAQTQAQVQHKEMIDPFTPGDPSTTLTPSASNSLKEFQPHGSSSSISSSNSLLRMNSPSVHSVIEGEGDPNHHGEKSSRESSAKSLFSKMSSLSRSHSFQKLRGKGTGGGGEEEGKGKKGILHGSPHPSQTSSQQSLTWSAPTEGKSPAQKDDTLPQIIYLGEACEPYYLIIYKYLEDMTALFFIKVQTTSSSEYEETYVSLAAKLSQSKDSITSFDHLPIPGIEEEGKDGVGIGMGGEGEGDGDGDGAVGKGMRRLQSEEFYYSLEATIRSDLDRLLSHMEPLLESQSNPIDDQYKYIIFKHSKMMVKTSKGYAKHTNLHKVLGQYLLDLYDDIERNQDYSELCIRSHASVWMAIKRIDQCDYILILPRNGFKQLTEIDDEFKKVMVSFQQQQQQHDTITN